MVNDPLADPRATDLLTARPDDVHAIAATFRLAASESAITAEGLVAAKDDGVWSGKAATAFRHSIGRMPHQLERVHDGYAAVAHALTAYEPELARIQGLFIDVVARLGDVQGRLSGAITAAQGARTSFKQTAQTPGLPRGVLAGAELAVARADGAVRGYRGEAEELTVAAFALLDEFAAVRDTCHAAIAAAQRTAPVRPVSAVPVGVVGPGGALDGPRGARWALTGGWAAGAAAGQSAASQRARHADERAQAQAEARIETMIGRADALLGTPYVSGGGHAGWTPDSGLDCSGFVSAILRAGGYLNAPQTTEGFASQPGLAGGPGRMVTIYDRTGCGANEHVIIDLNGRFYESGGGSASGGAPFVHSFAPSPEYLASFNKVLHPIGL